MAEIPALLTRQEIAYLKGELSELTNVQKSKINYKIKKKIESLQLYEIPLLLRSGFLMNDSIMHCHSSDPGSNPGPGAYTFSSFNRRPQN